MFFKEGLNKFTGIVKHKINPALEKERLNERVYSQ
jgi:hypothetical protein